MPFAAAVSTNADTPGALEEVCASALEALHARPDLALLFFSPHHAEALERQAGPLQNRLGATALLGCSGESIVGNEQEIEQRPALSLWLAHWANPVRMAPFHLAFDRAASGYSIKGMPDGVAAADPRQSAIMLLGDPFSFWVDVFLQMVNSNFKGLQVLGGMASGGQAPGPRKLLLGDTMPKQGAVGVLLSGQLEVRCLVAQGCRPIGKPFVVTRAQGDVIVELEGKSPLAQLQQLWPGLSPRDQQLANGELLVGRVIGPPAGELPHGNFLVRSAVGLDRGSGALTIEDRVRTGETVQFLVNDADAADENLRSLLRSELCTREQKPGGALLFTCVRRGLRLFSRPHHDAAVLREEAGGIPAAGFFAEGEIGPVGALSCLHTRTASVVLFGDRSPA
jgi:small ligand-binding sensory domain FIST